MAEPTSPDQTPDPETKPSPTTPDPSSHSEPTRPKRTIKIGSQRDTDANTVPAKESVATSASAFPAEPVPVPADLPTNAAEAAIPHEESSPDLVPIEEKSFPPPRIDKLPEDVQREIDEALAGVSVTDLMEGVSAAAGGSLELGEKIRATVVKVHRDDVFFALPGDHEGVASLRQFEETP